MGYNEQRTSKDSRCQTQIFVRNAVDQGCLVKQAISCHTRDLLMSAAWLKYSFDLAKGLEDNLQPQLHQLPDYETGESSL